VNGSTLTDECIWHSDFMLNDGVMENDWPTPRPPVVPSARGRQIPWRQRLDSMSPVDSKTLVKMHAVYIVVHIYVYSFLLISF